MRYSIFAGGKRVRPALVILGGEICGGHRADLLEPAAALEMIHCFSLIHDDLPALDNDDLRRGRPSLHRHFDEAIAILAGDALLNLGIQVIASSPSSASAELRLRNVMSITEAVGTRGMIGGQIADLEGEKASAVDAEARLESIHRRKTGALLAASLEIGGRCAGAGNAEIAALDHLGQSLGLLFQIRDDLLDLDGDPEKIGKTQGKDVEADKLTYPTVFGVERARAILAEESDAAQRLLAEFPSSEARSHLEQLVHFLAQRDH